MYGSGLHVWLRDGFSWRTLQNNFVSQIVYLQYILSGGIFHNWLFAFHLTLVLTVIRWPLLSPVYQATSQMEDFKMRRRRRRSGRTLLMLLAPASIVPRTPDQDTNTTSCSVSSSGESNINTVNYSAILPGRACCLFSRLTWALHDRQSPRTRIPGFPYLHGFNVLILLWGNLGTRPYNNLMFLFMGRKFRGWMAW